MMEESMGKGKDEQPEEEKPGGEEIPDVEDSDGL